MSKVNNEVMQKKLASIKSGAYVFGIIGRLTIFVGVLGGLLFIGTSFIGGGEMNTGLTGQSLMNILYGWLFLKGRDAFLAIEALINEMGEIV